MALANACDSCSEMHTLLGKFSKSADFPGLPPIHPNDLNVLINYVNIWNQKHCFCFFKEIANFNRFDRLVQSLLATAIKLFKAIAPENEQDKQEGLFFEDWTNEDKEKLMQLTAKLFQSTFPLYIAQKHCNTAKHQELTDSDKKTLSSYCDFSDMEGTVFMARKLSYFHQQNGFKLFVKILENADPSKISIVFVHSVVSAVQNLKHYFMPSAINNALSLIRKGVIDYLCKMPDNELRVIGNRTMFEYVWSAIKEHNHNYSIDVDGLRIALKYFTSSTLTMRLTGLAQINNYISIYKDMHAHAGQSACDLNFSRNMEDEIMQWVIDNKIIENIFGPNLHVEVLKQCHFILTSIAPKITTEHIDIIWSSAQIKHYEKYIFEILKDHVKDFHPMPVLYLYSLVRKMQPKEHSEHSLHLASEIIKYIWVKHHGIQPDLNPTSHYIPSEKTLLEEANLTKNAVYSFFRDSAKTSSTSASSVEVSDEEEEEEEFDIDLSGQRLCNSDKEMNSKLNSEESSNNSDSDIDELNDLPAKVKTARHAPFLPELKNIDLNFDENSLKIRSSSPESPDLEKIDSEKDDKTSDDSLSEMDSHMDSIYEEEYNLDKVVTAQRRLSCPVNVVSNVVNGKMSVCVDTLLECSFQMTDVAKPGKTLLWDLLQDEMLNQLSEEMAIAVEKIFWQTLVQGSSREIRLSFIVACLENLSNNYSVLTSLRLLQKLFQSFYQYMDGKITRKLINDATKEKGMLKSFFANISLFMSCCKQPSEQFDMLKSKFATHKEEIKTRLDFLSFIFLYTGANEDLCFLQEHINILWEVFTNSDLPEIVDEFFIWLLNQVKFKNLNFELIKYILVEKLPQLSPESFSATSLELLQNLHGLVLSMNVVDTPTMTNVVQLLWQVAFKNPINEVSMSAIRHLNQYYINLLNCTNKFDKEEEFVKLCISNLKEASLLLPLNCDKSLVIIDRAVILLKNHLEVFYGRYSYFFRKLKLTSDAEVCHFHRGRTKHEPTIKFCVSSPYNSEKKIMEFVATDHIGDLRAEVQFWWQSILKKNEDNCTSESLICLVLHDQEIPFEYDDKLLSDIGFKEGHINQISFHTTKHSLGKTCDMFPSNSAEFLLSFKSKNSKYLLLESSNFELLFTLMQQLDMINVANIKARILSRNIWEIVQILPSSPDLVSYFDQLIARLNNDSTIDDAFEEELPNQDEEDRFGWLFEKIFPPDSNQKLIYSCQIADHHRRVNKSFANIFIKSGGLKYLYKLYINKVKSVRHPREWTEWKQDCFDALIQTIYPFAVAQFKRDNCKDEDKVSIGGSEGGPRKSKRSRKNSLEKHLVQPFNATFLEMIERDKLMEAFFSVLNLLSNNSKLVYQTSMWPRGNVVYYHMLFFTSWCLADLKVLEQFCALESFKSVIKQLILYDSDPAVRKEFCLALQRLCLGSAPDGTNVRHFIPQLLELLLSFLQVASVVNIAKMTANLHRSSEERDLSGPGSKDYFVLVSRLIEPYVGQISNQPLLGPLIDLDKVCAFLVSSILNRDILEARKNTIDDEGLRGLFFLLTVIMRHMSSLKSKLDCSSLISEIFKALFALPNQTHRNLPKCKSACTRSAAFDLLIELVKGNEDNYMVLANLLVDQHRHEILGRSSAYPWEYWPHDESRSDCGFVGLTNLGATCYMASCMQHLFMITEVRHCILATQLDSVIKHEPILRELQKMFIYLQESERKAYNPKSFCKVYTMDHQPLNICEQKDMTEFFTDLISKLEEMTVDLKDMMKKNFSGLQSNNVVSLDCPHISQTTEEFYTLRCQVADMKDLYESLNELTVKDTLEGDNMYNCSKCGKKVRAEKRACIKKLPKILCFNTMRYTFNMITMTKEKVNTHFSFPFTLDMAPYLEKNLLNISEEHSEQLASEDEIEQSASTKYELIGVTVHTGTAEGGHYYSFIQDRDPHSVTRNKWFLFNDAEVKPFDKSQIASECFGGETTSKQYDQMTDKFFDCNIEKTNSAYMLFYERIDDSEKEKCLQSVGDGVAQSLLDWIWDDNISFLRDQFIFEPHYFDFIWNVCTQVPPTLPCSFSSRITLCSARLATLFTLETLIHAKEKPVLAQWIEVLTKQFNNSQQACEWLMDHLSSNDWWSIQILFKCSNQMVRQLFIRLCVHVIGQLKPYHSTLYLHPHHPVADAEARKASLGRYSCVTRFIRRLVSLINIESMQTKPHIKNLTEYFSFLLEFAKKGDEECQFLLSIEAISTIINFYLNYGKVQSEFIDPFSDNEEDDFDERPHILGNIMEDKYPKLASLDRMISLVVYLLEKTQSQEMMPLSERDFDSLISGKNFLFIQQQIRDNINLRQTFNLMFILFRLDESLAPGMLRMIFASILRSPENSVPFFKILSFITENNSMFSLLSKMILPKIWELLRDAPGPTLEWLNQHAQRNKAIHEHMLGNLDQWVLLYLVEDCNNRVRSHAAQLLISLVPSPENSFRQHYRPFRPYPYSINKEIVLEPEGQAIVDKLFVYLLSLMKKFKAIDLEPPLGIHKLANYFYVATYLLVYTKQKRLLLMHFNEWWSFCQARIIEPNIPSHPNKQGYMMFFYMAMQECPEAVRFITNHSPIWKKIAFNYILADHDDQDVVIFNKNMLPYYYAALRICCLHSRTFTRYLATHQNLQWAFQNITPQQSLFPSACQELLQLMKIFTTIHEDSTEDEKKAVRSFKQTTIKTFMNHLNTSMQWATLISVLPILVDQHEDLVYLIRNNGVYMIYQTFCALNIMFHEATACHITHEMIQVLGYLSRLFNVFETDASNFEVSEHLASVKEFVDAKKFIYLLNTYTPHALHMALFDVLEKLCGAFPSTYLKSISNFLYVQHILFSDQHYSFVAGPFFPKKGQRNFQAKSSIRPARPVFQMCFSLSNLEITTGKDKEYEGLVYEFYRPYYRFLVKMARIAMARNIFCTELADLTIKVALESLYFHCPYFGELWAEIFNNPDAEFCRLFIDHINSSKDLREYLNFVLVRERNFLTVDEVYSFCHSYLSQAPKKVFTSSLVQHVVTLINEFNGNNELVNRLLIYQTIADLRAVKLISLEGGFDSESTPVKNFCNHLQILKSKLNQPPNLEDTQNQMPPNKRIKLNHLEEEVNKENDSVRPSMIVSDESTNECNHSSSSSSSSSSSNATTEQTKNKLIAVIDDILAQLKPGD